MKRSKTKVSKSASFSKNLLLFALFFVIGAASTALVTRVFVHADTSEIHACVRNSTSAAGAPNVRIVGADDTCSNNETPLSWNIQGPPGSSESNGLPFICNTCQLYPFASVFQGKDFSNAQIPTVNFTGADIHGVTFKGAIIDQGDFSNANLTGADFSNLFITRFQDPDLSGGSDFVNSVRFLQANLTNANFSDNTFGGFGTSFARANLQGTNFSGTTFKGVDFTGATNMSTANLTNTTWSNTRCPDGTNSDNDGNTCVGHLNP